MVFDVSEFLGWTGMKAVFGEYALAVLVFILSWVVLKIFQTIILRKLRKLSEMTENKVDDIIVSILEAMGWPFYLIISLYISFQFIALPDMLERVFTYLAFIVVIYYIVKGISRAIDFTFENYIKKEKVFDKEFDPSVAEIMISLIKGFIWLLAILLFLQNQGYEVSAVLAGLGIGGIAVAFALQNILADIFAYFSIAFDKPFRMGDYIVIGNDMGIVKKIGLKSTRIQTLQGEELIVSNKDLTNSRVRNYKKMESRTVIFDLAVAYKTPEKKISEIPRILEGIMKRIKLAEFERAYIKSIKGSSVTFEVSYKIKSPKYKYYVNVQHELNLAIKREFDRKGIVLA